LAQLFIGIMAENVCAVTQHSQWHPGIILILDLRSAGSGLE
jgi:hypothetical protein